MKKVPAKPVAKSWHKVPRVAKPVVEVPSPTALVELTDEEIAYIVYALRFDDSNPDVITPLMAKLACYLAGAVFNK